MSKAPWVFQLHGVRAGATGAVILDIFSPPRAEYKQAGAGFGTAAIKSN